MADYTDSSVSSVASLFDSSSDVLVVTPLPSYYAVAAAGAAATRAAPLAKRPSARRANSLIASSAVAAAASSLASIDRPPAAASKRKTKPKDPETDEFKAKYADTLAALAYCYQRSPDEVAARALVARQPTAASDDDGDSEDIAALAMQDAYADVYQSFQPLMLLATDVTDYHDATQKVEVPDYMAADVAAAIAETGRRRQDPEFWLADASKRSETAELAIIDPELAALLADADDDVAVGQSGE